MTSASHPSIPRGPEVPIASSQALGWKPLLVEEFQQPSGGMAQPEVWTEHAITLCLAPHPHRISLVADDYSYRGLYGKGDIAIMPAGSLACYQTEGHDHYLQLQLAPQFLQQVAHEAMELDPSRIELKAGFRIRNPQLEQLLLLLRSELHKGNDWIGRLYIESLANALAVQLLREYSTAQPRVAVYEGGLGDRKLLQVTDYINDALDQDIKLADLAQLLGMSQSHFSQLFKRSMGMSAHQYLLQQRIERAKQLLKQTDQSVVDIALACGFNSHSHLSKQFRQLTGLTPKAYRAN
jgi:AraC family transcriptional regulator